MSDVDLGGRMVWNVDSVYQPDPTKEAMVVMRCVGCTSRGARCRVRSGWLLLSAAPLEWACRWHS